MHQVRPWASGKLAAVRAGAKATVTAAAGAPAGAAGSACVQCAMDMATTDDEQEGVPMYKLALIGDSGKAALHRTTRIDPQSKVDALCALCVSPRLQVWARRAFCCGSRRAASTLAL